MFVMTVALSGLVNDYLQSVSDSDDSEPKPLIVFTTDDDNSDHKGAQGDRNLVHIKKSL